MKKTGLAVVKPAEMDSSHNPLVVFLSGVAPRSRLTYLGDLRGIALLMGFQDPYSLPWEDLRFQHVSAIRTALIERDSERTGKPLTSVTITRKISALRGVLRAAWKLELITSEEYYRAVSVGGVKGHNLPSGRELSNNEMIRLMTVCNSDPKVIGIRDSAIIATLYTCGLRRSELVNIDLSDYDPETGKIKIMGKGSKQRFAFLVNEAKEAVDTWIQARGNFPGPLILPYQGKSFEPSKRRMTDAAIYYVLVKRAKQAGITDLSPHDLRRTFVGALLTAGVDLSTVSKMAGHSSTTTTSRYDVRPEAVQKEAAKLLHVPARKKK